MYTLEYNFDGKDFYMDVDIKDYANKLPNIKLIEQRFITGIVEAVNKLTNRLKFKRRMF